MHAIIIRCVRWYAANPSATTDVEELTLERGLRVDHTTLYGWVKLTAHSWTGAAATVYVQAVTQQRIDEIFIKVKGQGGTVNLRPRVESTGK